MITSEFIAKHFDVGGIKKFSCARLGVASDSDEGGVLSFIAAEKYLGSINANLSIRAVFVTMDLSVKLAEHIVPIIVDDPIWYFFSLVNYQASQIKHPETVIGEDCSIASSAVIAAEGVIIGDGVTVEPNVVVHPGVTIGSGVLLRAGAVLGCDGYEHKRTSKGILSVLHDGKVSIGNNVEVGANTFVAKGFSYRATVVGEETKIDALVHYAHGVQSGQRCFIVANAMIGGNVTMGDDVWVGPSSSIANRLTLGSRAFVTMGAVVTKDVGEDEKVTGNFAVPHQQFLKNLKKSMLDD